MQNYVLKNNELLADCQVKILQKYTSIISSTGSGKTHWAITELPKLFPDQNILILVPYQTIAKQKAEHYQIHGVYAGSHENQNRIQIAVYDCLNQFTDLSNTVVVVDEFHHLTLSQGYRKPALEAIMECGKHAYRMIFMSGTKVRSYHPILRWHCDTICITRESDRDIECTAIKSKYTLKSILNRLDQNKLTIVYMNKKRACEQYANFVKAHGYTPLVLTTETKNSVEFQEILRTKQVSDSINVIFTTAVFSEGIDLDTTRETQVIFVTHEDPAIIRQVIGRFRKTLPSKIYIFLIQGENNPQAGINPNKLYDRYEKKAQKLVDTIHTLQEYLDESHQIIKDIRMNLLFENQLLVKNITPTQYEICESGISCLVRRKEVYTMYKNESTLKKHLKEYHLLLTGYEVDSTSLSTLEQIQFEQIKSLQKQQDTATMKKELLQQQQNKLREAMKTAIQKTHDHITTTVSAVMPVEQAQDIATQVIEASKGNRKTLFGLQKLVQYQVAKKLGHADPFLNALEKTLESCQRKTAAYICKKVKQIYAEFQMYEGVHLTSNQAIGIFRMFYQFRRTKTSHDGLIENIYVITSTNPLAKYDILI